VVQALRARGFTILLVEQNFRFAAPLSDRFYVLEHGRVVDAFGAGELAGRGERLAEMLGV
jgi:branched-chain amino acid transport system ATP-binding protein